jgi:hypothetical protein
VWLLLLDLAIHVFKGHISAARNGYHALAKRGLPFGRAPTKTTLPVKSKLVKIKAIGFTYFLLSLYFKLLAVLIFLSS